MDEMLFRVFAENAGRYLDAVERLADRSPAAASRQACVVLADELRRLVAAWRALLERHQPAGPRGHCAGCASRCAGVLWRRRPMCGVWKVANAYFVRAPES